MTGRSKAQSRSNRCSPSFFDNRHEPTRARIVNSSNPATSRCLIVAFGGVLKKSRSLVFVEFEDVANRFHSSSFVVANLDFERFLKLD